MEQRQKEIISLTVMALSFILLIAFLPVLVATEYDSATIMGATLLVLVVVFFGSMIAAIAYSDSGWRVEGSTLEWVVAAIIAPFWTIIIYFMSDDRDDREYIDLDDSARLERL